MEAATGRCRQSSQGIQRAGFRKGGDLRSGRRAALQLARLDSEDPYTRQKGEDLRELAVKENIDKWINCSSRT